MNTLCAALIVELESPILPSATVWLTRVAENMSFNQFISLVKYKPTSIVYSDYDDLYFVEFRRKGSYTASIEFGTEISRRKKGKYFYFEIVDWRGVDDGELVPLDSERRKDVILRFVKSDSEYEELADIVNEKLGKLYKRKEIR